MQNAHPLDRPIWSAFTTRQAALASGDARAVRLKPDYGIFVAAADRSAENLAALAQLVPAGVPVASVEVGGIPVPPGLEVVSTAICNQMIAAHITPGEPDFEVVALTDVDAPEMLALATLTKPGPFAARTHQLGDFIGVKQGGRLVAMAGERMKPTGFTEVSGVCTLPEWRGRGYAGGLMRLVAARILERGEAPFLHVYADNAGAIALYEALGFRFRQALTMTVLRRK
ncbi:MAG TPA: GNAT family N-acetyltransferase [Alphaproteobacteria bacterium]|nr:GNAT family N-acetyltransferase [Alphaproteobacteria bacterium]